MNIFVTRLDFRTREEDLKSAFAQYGEVSSVKIVMDKMTGRSKGYGFVEMPSDDDAMSAINALNETELQGKTIIVKKAEPREGGNSRPGGGGGGGFRGGNTRNRRF